MSRAKAELRRLLASLALMMPAAIPYVTHVMVWKEYSLPTGYIQSDMPIYMAKAREAFDDGGFHVFYGNPCGGSYDEPRIYFQPWTFALGLIHRYSGLRPGVLFVAFWFVVAWAAARVALAIYEEYVGLDSRSKRLGLIAFLWGGGLLVVSGAARAMMWRGSVGWDDLFSLDPFRGWWFLNLGRNLVYPTEALYHAVAFASLVQAARSRLARAWIFAAITSACSPFAGLQLLAILWLWGVVEIAVSTDRRRAACFLLAVSGLVAVFFGYYLLYLNGFSEHRALAGQMTLNWRYSYATLMAAYGPVFLLAAWRIRSRSRAARVFSEPRSRLLLAWAVASLALENHDLFLSPRQPLHFTRGYTWSALFLLGTPVLVAGFARLGRVRQPWAIVGRSLLLVAILLDNAVWFGGFVREMRVPDRNGLRITSEALAVLRRLDEDDLLGYVVVSEDERVSYLVIAETRLRSVMGHKLETPGYLDRHREVDSLFGRGEFPPTWNNRPMVIVRYHRPGEPILPKWLKERGAEHAIFQNRKFQIFQIRGNRRSISPNSGSSSGL